MRAARTWSILLVPLAFLLLPSSPALADPLPERADRVVSYTISVRLNPSTKQLEGRETVTWRNPSTDTVSDLWLHLYLNAFKNTASTFVRESGGQLRGDRMSDKAWGWIDVSSFKLASGEDLTAAIRFEHPDDDNADDRTVIRVALPQPVPPKGELTFEVAFKAQLPEVFARSGYKRDFYLVGQWFPKLGVYESAGMRGRAAGGWNCHQYHANSEFYADYGEFHVEMTVPSTFVVGATGERKGRIDHKNGTVTYIYEQADVHDFAWTADPNYVEDPPRLLGRPRRDAAGIRAHGGAARPSARRGAAERRRDHAALPAGADAARRALHPGGEGRHQGLRPPLRPLSLQDAHRRGPAAGRRRRGRHGVPDVHHRRRQLPDELLALQRPARRREASPSTSSATSSGTAMVGNNEFEEAWLDEGINTYATGLVQEAEYGASTSNGRFLALDLGEIDTLRATVASFSTTKDAIVKPAWMYTGDYGYYCVHEAGGRVAHATRLPGRPGHGAGDADVPGAVALPPPVERGLLRCRQRGIGEGPRLPSSDRRFSAATCSTTRWTPFRRVRRRGLAESSRRTASARPLVTNHRRRARPRATRAVSSCGESEK